MGFILGFILLVLFAGLFIFLVILGFLRSLFSFGRKNKSYQAPQEETSNSNGKKQNKIFGNNEGEYVDYEEIKD